MDAGFRMWLVALCDTLPTGKLTCDTLPTEVLTCDILLGGNLSVKLPINTVKIWSNVSKPALGTRTGESPQPWGRGLGSCGLGLTRPRAEILQNWFSSYGMMINGEELADKHFQCPRMPGSVFCQIIVRLVAIVLNYTCHKLVFTDISFYWHVWSGRRPNSYDPVTQG